MDDLKDLLIPFVEHQTPPLLCSFRSSLQPCPKRLTPLRTRRREQGLKPPSSLSRHGHQQLQQAPHPLEQRDLSPRRGLQDLLEPASQALQYPDLASLAAP